MLYNEASAIQTYHEAGAIEACHEVVPLRLAPWF